MASGRGQYVGTYLAWDVHNNGWWGEGEIKFYMDGDVNFPTINGTGTEDYFNGSYDFEHPVRHDTWSFTTPSLRSELRLGRGDGGRIDSSALGGPYGRSLIRVVGEEGT